jgi:3-hydroxyacyl-[acyl-carrier-protein] dehydratase
MERGVSYSGTKLSAAISGETSEKVSFSEIGYDEIQRILPQKEPFILVDKVLELKLEKYIVCQKNISGSDPWFRGHFPGNAIMPGAMMAEAIAQSALILAIYSYPQFKNKIAVFGSIRARFTKPVRPGDCLIIRVELDKIISRGGVVSAVAKVGGKKVISASLSFGIKK